MPRISNAECTGAECTGLNAPVPTHSAYEPTYNLVDALSVYPFGSREVLYLESCTAVNSTHFDCISQCSDKIFDDLFTLHNCAAVSTVQRPPNDSHALSLPVSLENTKQAYIITPDTNDTANRIAEVIWDCLSWECEQLTDCKDGPKDGPQDYFTNNSPSDRLYLGGYDLAYQVCDAIEAKLNADVGGIGVYLSYWIHIGLAILGFCASIILKFLVPSVSKIKRRCFKPWHPRIVNPANHANTHFDSLISGLVDFHKAQCFFTIAINIAAIKIQKLGGLEPKSTAELYINYMFLKVIAVSGYLPVTLVLFNLYLVHEVDWFLIFLSSGSIAFAIATLSVLGRFSPSARDWEHLREEAGKGGPPQCHSKQPWTYCWEPIGWSLTKTSSPSLERTDNSDAQAWGVLGFCLVVIAFLVASKVKLQQPPIIRRTLQRIRKLFDPHDRNTAPAFSDNIDQYSNSRSKRLFNCIYRSIMHISLRGFQPCLYIAFTAVYMYFIICFLRDLAWFATNKVYNSTWNFGQVVALMVWVPPICEFLHYELRGITKSFQHKLPPRYEVAKQRPTTPTDETAYNTPQIGMASRLKSRTV